MVSDSHESDPRNSNKRRAMVNLICAINISLLPGAPGLRITRDRFSERVVIAH
jgi:hypothetical protein